MRHVKLESLYENMLMPIGPMSVSVGPGPDILNSSCESEELTEEEEVSLAKKILKLTDTLDDLASEAHVKTYRRRIEDISEMIRKHAKKLVSGHPSV